MTTPTVQYTHLSYEDYKRLEKQMKEFRETTHTTATGFHHKSVRLVINDGLIIEYHGPMVGGYGHAEGGVNAVKAA